MALKFRILTEQRRALLRSRLSDGRVLRAIECHNPLSAMLGEAARGKGKARFDALWASGFANATALGLPDAGLGLLERKLEGVSDIMASTSLPVIADADTGGDALALAKLCLRLEMLGVSAVVVEDKAGAKRTSLAVGAEHQMEDPDRFVAKIAAAKHALLSSDMMVFARIESLIAGLGEADALSRAEAYLTSDADGLAIHSKEESGREILSFLDAYRSMQERLGISKPLAVIPTAYNHLTGAELAERGASIVIHGNHMVRAAYQAMKRAAKSILDHDRSLEADSLCAPVSQLLDAVGFGAEV